jgi:hypothetical protein
MKKSVRAFTESEIEALLRTVPAEAAVPASTDDAVLAMIRANTRDYVAPRTILPFRPKTVALAGGLAAASLAIALTTMLVLRSSNSGNIAFQASVINAVDAHDASASTELTRGMKITQGAKFRTGQGELFLSLAKGTRVLLAPNSVLSISRLDASGSNIELMLQEGSVSAQVRKLEANDSFIVNTPDEKITVRGTEFLVSHKDNLTSVSVREGLVSVERAGTEIAQVPAGRTLVANGALQPITAGDSSSIALLRTRWNAYLNESAYPVADNAAPSTKKDSIIAPKGRVIDDPEFLITEYSLTLRGDREWLSSGIAIAPGDLVEIRADGSVSTIDGGTMTGPNGEESQPTDDGRLLPSAPYGALIMSPDKGRTAIYTGRSDKYRASTSGMLSFTVNDKPGCYQDNEGQFTIRVTVKRKK